MVEKDLRVIKWILIGFMLIYTQFEKNEMFGTEDNGTIDASYQNIFDNLEEQLPEDE